MGYDGPRGVVASASYEARTYGIRSAMPSVRAKRLCPDAIFLPSDFEAYRAHSNRFREVLLSYTPIVEPISLDEAFLDVGGATTLFGEPAAIAARIRADVEREVGVTCSVGVAPTKFVAKLASDLCKPDGMLVVAARRRARVPRSAAGGAAVGGRREDRRDCSGGSGIRTVRELGDTPEVILTRVLGDQSARHLRNLAHGVDDREVVPYEAPKSVSHEETFQRDLDADEDVLRELLALSGRVAARLRADGYRARTVVLKARLANFTTLTRSRTLPDPPTWARTCTTWWGSCTGPCRASDGGSGCWACRPRA